MAFARRKKTSQYDVSSRPGEPLQEQKGSLISVALPIHGEGGMAGIIAQWCASLDA
ncbi:MAG: hypothetical protein ACI9C4_003199 [Paraglaciecola sp.]|jgi:hypothetical protein